MKKCPKCQADIQENARFCLYCMTSLEEKQPIETPKENDKRWLYFIAAVLVFVIIGLCIWTFKGNDNSIDTSSDAYSESQTSADTGSTVFNQDNSAESNSSSQTTTDKQTSADKSGKSDQSTTQNNSSNNNSSSKNNNTSANSNTNSNSTTSTDKESSTSTQTSTTTSINSTTTGTTSDNSSTNEPSYTYIEATIENAYPTGYTTMYAPENAIVITKVNYKEASGNYIIPDTVDGKKVAAIMPSAFSDADIRTTVKSVTLPSTVRTIWSDAFKGCYNLKDIYIKSSVIGIYTDAFPEVAKRTGTLTIYCARDCRNFDFYYYRNIAGNYGAEYEEWNG